MPTEHIVQAGDCIDSIAVRFGFFPDTLWKHGDNAELKEKRKDPNVLAPGDIVVIPDKRVKEESGATEQHHKFKRKGVPAKLRMKLMKPKEPPPPPEESAGGADDESNYSDPPEDAQAQEFEPIANAPFVLELDGQLIEGQTDGDGVLELAIPPGASKGTLRVNHGTPEERVYPLDLGGMDPVDSLSGASKRLNNLGYTCPLDATEITPEVKDVLMRFQHDNGIETSGALDQATQDKLKKVHGC